MIASHRVRHAGCDVQLKTTAMRQLTLAHGLVSVAFTLLVLARTINGVADALV